ncbi:hypothetical protein Egran_02316 [Elaphomyces granulatus]|uniref:Uncharacterized protein n=1 Tax=Elaphomyces granulatus TaxID=519963 RepID=A0A232M0I1_9EURO|nr:hypothetical protein Egran_02316 [Elaphomyces granulatus]
MDSLNEARARWKLLRIIHPLFSENLPTTFSTQSGPLHGDALERLNNEITKLRSEIKLNILRQDQHHDDLERLLDTSSAEQLIQSAGYLLNEFETLIDDEILCGGGVKLGEAEMGSPMIEDTIDLSSYPKIRSLRNLLRKYETRHRLAIESSPAMPPDRNDPLDDDIDFDPSHEISQISCFIHFPENEESLASSRRVMQQFGMTIMKVFADKVGRRDIEARTQRFTKSEVEILQSAFAFASTYEDLFSHINMPACGERHQAKVYLCGLKGDQLKVSIGTCQENQWISAIFKRSVDELPATPFLPAQVCASATVPECQPMMKYIAFNKTTMWEQHNAPNPEPETSTSDDPYRLKTLLGRAAPDLYSQYFSLKHRELLGYLLAFALFQLYGSPWIRTHLCHDTVFLHPCSDRGSRLYQWRPHVHCALVPIENILNTSDYMAAFGVLFMELEAGESAEWTEDDIDWEMGTRSNQVRLGRILKEWKEKVRDDYRLVGKACHDFESLIETFDHPDVGDHLNYLAIVYKCILEPLFQILRRDFGSDAQLFQGIPSPRGDLSASANHIPSKVAKRELFDDFDMAKSDKKVKYAKDFMKELEPFFTKIRDTRTASPSILTEPSQGKERIKIAILDSGVDDTDQKISGAIRSGRIIDRRSWVGNVDDHQDTYGHGTHVTRFLLDTAPAAEICIAKICKGKVINAEFMPGIAKAIDWAVDEWKAHIISLSFGFDDAHDLIDAAIDRAVKERKLIFAAASNGGGVKSRTRPATNPDVLCIHACDGLGNKGDMSPNPWPKAHNFTTLGVGVYSRWKKDGKREDVWKSGTSFATPIAVGFAADVLEFANFRCTLSDHKHAILQERRGMVALFQRMSDERERYDFVHPMRLWDGRSDEKVAEDIEKVIDGL